jgi:glycosyltransferase involved in cell wall biosynthesis
MISVIIPVYNPGEKLRDCLDSVINQEYKDLQIILVDDGSTDDSSKICDEYAKKDNRIEVYHQENSGPSVARNKGIDVANGDYIAFVDSDDTINKEMYKELYEVAIKENVEMVTSDAIMGGVYSKTNLPENRIIEKKEISSNILPMFTKTDTICVFEFKNKIMSRELLNNSNIRFDENICFQEDLIFMINVYGNLSSMYYLPKAFYNYVPVSSGLYSSYRKDGGESEKRSVVRTIVRFFRFQPPP